MRVFTARWAKPWQRGLDLLAPIECAGCDGARQADPAFCEACLAWLSPTPSVDWASPLGVPTASVGAFEGPLARAIRRLKYDRRPELAGPLAAHAAAALWLLAPHHGVTLVPVPLHRARLVERGFNQAALLARHLATGSPHTTQPLALRRQRDTPRQVTLDREARLGNLRGAIALRGRPPMGPVILVDDVLTTGATLASCLAALRGAGVRPLGVVTLAHARCPSLDAEPT